MCWDCMEWQHFHVQHLLLKLTRPHQGATKNGKPSSCRRDQKDLYRLHSYLETNQQSVFCMDFVRNIFLFGMLTFLTFYGHSSAADKVPKFERIKKLPHPGEFYFNLTEERSKPHSPVCQLGLEKIGNLESEAPAKIATSIKGKAPVGTTFGVRELVWGSVLTIKPDEQIAQLAKKELLLWSRADAFNKFVPEQSWQWWSVYTMMPGLLTTYQRLNEMGTLNHSESNEIHRWFEKLVKHIKIGNELPPGTAGNNDIEQRLNNHNTRRNLISVLWGIETNDARLVNYGIENGYIRFLKNIKKDGSVFDANRGMWAMRYTSFNISAALFIAEAAKHQGVDLYGLIYNGQSIHTSVKFFLDSYSDEELINRYAKSDIGMKGMPFAGKQTGWLVVYDGVMGFVGWIDLYIHNFPDSENTKRLKVLRQDFVNKTGFDYLFDWSFGNVTCFYH